MYPLELELLGVRDRFAVHGSIRALQTESVAIDATDVVRCRGVLSVLMDGLCLDYPTNPYFPDSSVVSAWRLRLFPRKTQRFQRLPAEATEEPNG